MPLYPWLLRNAFSDWARGSGSDGMVRWFWWVDWLCICMYGLMFGLDVERESGEMFDVWWSFLMRVDVWKRADDVDDRKAGVVSYFGVR
jgi:hypothetical protein